MNEKWYNINGKSTEGIVDIYIFDEIGSYGVNAQSFIEEVKAYKKRPMNLHINCVGGDVFDGMAIYNILKKRTAETTVYIEGIAASMGSVIALAADNVVMAENSLFMIHNAWGGAMGEAKEMRKTAKLLEKISNEIADIYVKKTKMPYDKVKEMMDEETWLNAEEAYSLGFIDSISDAIKVAAKYDVSKFKNITNEEIKNKLNINLKSKKMTDELKTWFNGKVEEIIAKVKNDNSSETVEAKSEVEVSIADEAEILNKFSNLETEITTMNGSIAELEGEKLTLTEEVERLNALLSKANAKGTEISTDGDPAVVVENKVEDNDAKFWNGMLAKINLK
ncbi:ATP-dependent Clp protease proteolytic subunit [Porticoccaceae bacterium]|nr:ATP-dependent Clp protease proteolytic subunit [Porticoccaceae bacterium]|tara:strand:- start:6841 stop:7848 length:1008 start_codon:yes stop_codon:yes gene_type:complete